jgi:hypothetical protein
MIVVVVDFFRETIVPRTFSEKGYFSRYEMETEFPIRPPSRGDFMIRAVSKLQDFEYATQRWWDKDDLLAHNEEDFEMLMEMVREKLHHRLFEAPRESPTEKV